MVAKSFKDNDAATIRGYREDAETPSMDLEEKYYELSNAVFGHGLEDRIANLERRARIEDDAPKVSVVPCRDVLREDIEPVAVRVGDTITVEDDQGKQEELLVGDINILGGLCDCCSDNRKILKVTRKE